MKQEHAFQNKERSTKLLSYISHPYIAVNTGQAKMKNKSEERISFCRRMLIISLTEHMSQDEVLEKMEANRTLIFLIRKRQLKFRGENEERMRGKFDTHII